jgi:antitoxin (DNA-binding transcriptional repressor) of toxin-antitoxin stability system
MSTNKIRRVTVTEAARNFADIVNRAFYRGETTVLTRNGQAVAHIAPAAPIGLPVAEIRRRLKLRRRMSPENAEAFARDIEEARKSLPPLRDPWQ